MNEVEALLYVHKPVALIPRDLHTISAAVLSIPLTHTLVQYPSLLHIFSRPSLLDGPSASCMSP